MSALLVLIVYACNKRTLSFDSYASDKRSLSFHCYVSHKNALSFRLLCQ